jgi:hypothetical protein
VGRALERPLGGDEPLGHVLQRPVPQLGGVVAVVIVDEHHGVGFDAVACTPTHQVIVYFLELQYLVTKLNTKKVPKKIVISSVTSVLSECKKSLEDKGDWFPIINSTYTPTNHRLNRRIRSSKFNWAPCAQLYRAHEFPHPSLILSLFYLIYRSYTSPLLAPKKTTYPCDPPLETLRQTYVNKLSLNS